jgi:hypothetical protein
LVMGEERLARIEEAIAGLATKAELEVAVTTAGAGLATKADIAEAITAPASGRLREVKSQQQDWEAHGSPSLLSGGQHAETDAICQPGHSVHR